MIRPVISSLLFFFALNAWSEADFLKLFQHQKPMIAAIMVPKDLSTEEKVKAALKWSEEQIRIAEQAGMDGILFEFRGGKILEPKITEAHFQKMLSISKSLVKSTRKLVVGVEILWHFPEETLRLAKESGAAFVRIDFFSDEVIADQKKVPIDPKKIINYRKKIGAENVKLLTDIQVKYSKMVDSTIPLDVSAKRAVGFGSDGVIVTSTKSGRAPTPERPALAQKGAGLKPVLIGSGFSDKYIDSLLPHADAVIVGTSISVETGGPLIATKAQQLMEKVRAFRQKKTKKKYPPAWWAKIPKEQRKSWEISPDSVEFPKVILSKRNELGLQKLLFIWTVKNTPVWKVFGSH